MHVHCFQCTYPSFVLTPTFRKLSEITHFRSVHKCMYMCMYVHETPNPTELQALEYEVLLCS